MKQRLFIGLPVRGDIATKIASLNFSTEKANLRLTSPENLHVTVLFLGYVEADAVEAIKALLEKIASRTKNFSLNTKQILLAPPQGGKNMFWLTFQESREFVNLVEKVFKELGKFSRERTHREPLPHITLARSKQTLKQTDLTLKPNVLQGTVLKVAEIVLFVSKPFRSGSNYTRLETFKLGS